VTELVAAFIAILGLCTFLADVYGLLDQLGKMVLLSVNHCHLGRPSTSFFFWWRSLIETETSTMLRILVVFWRIIIRNVHQPNESVCWYYVDVVVGCSCLFVEIPSWTVVFGVSCGFGDCDSAMFVMKVNFASFCWRCSPQKLHVVALNRYRLGCGWSTLIAGTALISTGWLQKNGPFRFLVCVTENIAHSSSFHYFWFLQGGCKNGPFIFLVLCYLTLPRGMC